MRTRRISAKVDSESGALFSPCRTWRYALWRRWNDEKRANCVAFIGVNPSTADEKDDDPTIRRCIGFAKSWGYGGLCMLNAYAFCATDPAALKSATDPIGPENDEALLRFTADSVAIVAAWGRHCGASRAEEVCRLVARPIECLGRNLSGSPRHPLYLPAGARRELYWRPARTA
ncbi:MAG TPA: DUF1643 domain-containing protein [Planctomycetia bacterium]|nr:DUF1643 domain-containing protein [Planctomycetia bacterium]